MQQAATRNIGILMICQCVATSATVLVVTIGGIVGSVLAPNPAWATLPLSLMVVGTAGCAVPAAQLMRRIGRRNGFALAALVAACAALLGAAALSMQSFSLFCVCTCLIGAKVAFSQQYRFAAAESVPLENAGRAVSMVLLGAVGGAFGGPALVTVASSWGPATPFVGSFLAVAALFVASAMLLLLLQEPPAPENDGAPRPGRGITALARQPLFVIAVLGGVVGQGVMTFIMTATPISMHVLDGFTLAETSSVIRGHVLAMYLPSLASALLIGWLGVGRLMALGVTAFVVTLTIALQGHAYLHYWFSLLLLGIGWNFLFVGGTSLLVRSYRPEERFTAQGANDFCVFGIAALGSLLAGSVVHANGWEGVLWGSVPLVGVMVLALVWLAALRRGRATPAEP
jgi:MFS family permease